MESQQLSDLETTIINFLLFKFEDTKIMSVYGIGSEFDGSIKRTSNVDIIVLLRNIEDAPSVEWTTSRFENVTIDNKTVTFLYATFPHYLDPSIFDTISFANWEWAVRSLKFGSVLLYGEDIRDQLPTPSYNIVQIFKRCMYYLEPTPEWKFERAKKEGKIIDEEMRFSKAVLKYGFFIVASLCPDENIFKINDVLNKLRELAECYYIDPIFVKFYENALKYRNYEQYVSYNQCRKEFMICSIREGMKQLEIEWNGNEMKKGMEDILKEGMGKYPFNTLFIHYKNFGLN
jgi:hypothetical protein